MKISPLFLAIRAISTEFAQRIYVPVVLVAGGIALIVIGLLVWLVTMSGWWWLLLVPVIMLTLLFILAAVIAGIVLKKLRPTQTKDQRAKVKSFVDTIQKTSEAVQTPKFIILFRLVKDTVVPSENGYVRELSSGAISLKNGLKDIVVSFK